jgi:pimeloyl-ACP methyl ester carboxylesterase
MEFYTLDVLRDDIIGIIHHFKREKVVIIAHDWGGVQLPT